MTLLPAPAKGWKPLPRRYIDRSACPRNPLAPGCRCIPSSILVSVRPARTCESAGLSAGAGFSCSWVYCTIDFRMVKDSIIIFMDYFPLPLCPLPDPWRRPPGLFCTFVIILSSRCHHCVITVIKCHHCSPLCHHLSSMSSSVINPGIP